MAKQVEDRTTIELFEATPQRGRPKTNPLSRKDQLKHNKRKQVRRDKAAGLKRVELKLHEGLVSRLDQLADAAGVSRGDYIAAVLKKQIEPNERHAQ